MRRFSVLFFLLLSGLISSVHAQATSVVSQTFLQSLGNGETAYLIAKAPASSNSTYDHLHLVATLDCSYYAACDSTIDLTIGNRSGFTAVYTARGGNPVGLTTHIVAYQQSDNSVNIYVDLPNNYVTATYSILENIEDTVYSSPAAISVTTSSPLPGTLIFDTNSASYAPQTFTDVAGDFFPKGKVGIGTSSPLAPLSVGSTSQFQVSATGAVSAPSLSLTTALPVTSGGTGVATLTGLVKGNGTSAFTAAVAGSDYQAPIALTTTGTGAATFSGNVLNIPQSASTSGANTWTGAQTFGASVNFAGNGVWNSSGSVGIGTATPMAPLDVVGTRTDQSYAGGHHLVNYGLGYGKEDPDSGDIILLVPASTGTSVSGSQFAGTIQSNRGSAAGWNLNSQWYVSVQSAYTNNTGSITPLSGQQEYAGIPTLITCVYNGQAYIGFRTPANSLSAWSLDGNWSNSQNSQTPVLVASSAVSNIVPLVSYESVGSQISMMGVGSAAKVGIGTTTPSVPLEVNGSIKMDGGSLTFPDGSTLSSAADINQLGLGSTAISTLSQSNGNIGIGTTNPGAKLDVEGGGVNIGSGGSLHVAGGGDGVNPPIHFTSFAPSGYNPAGNLGIWLDNGGVIDANTPFNAYGQIQSIQSGPIGGTLAVNNPSKTTAGTANSWKIYNTTGSYGNSLQFWDYDTIGCTTGGLCSPRLTLMDSGNVGIGTSVPTESLQVVGNIQISGTGSGIKFPDGSVQTQAYSGTCTATGGDYAESVDVTGEKSGYEPGDVMVLDPSNKGHFLVSTEPYSTLVAGIYSTKPGYVGRRQRSDPKLSTTEIPMAMIGIVPTKVTTENGPIKIGDLLVTSTKPGYVMKGTDRSQMIGSVVGKAMGSLDSGTGVIEVLVSLQ